MFGFVVFHPLKTLLLCDLVTARDSDGMAGTLPVRITVTDMNEHVPHFTSHTLHLKVRADGETGLVIGSVTAIDLDGSK